MFDYLQQFNKLPKEIRDKISQPQVMKEIDRLESKYKVELAALVMKIMVRQIPLRNLNLYLVGQFDLDEKQASTLDQELKSKIFSLTGDYFKEPEVKKKITEIKPKETLKSEPEVTSRKQSVSSNIDQIVKDAQISLSSRQLSDRLRLVLNTYIRGVRDRVATRSVLARAPQESGLGLDQATIDKLFKLISSSQAESKTEIKLEQPAPRVLQQADAQDKLESLAVSYSLEKSIKEKQAKENLAVKKAPEQPEIRKALAPPPPAIREDSKEKIDLEKIIKRQPEAIKQPIEKKIEQPKVDVPNNLPISELVKKKEKKITKIKEVVKETPKPELKPKLEIKSDLQVKPKPTPQPLNIVGGKQRMDDIKKVSRVMDPIDELRYLNLLNFRRLGDSPKDGINKIKEKLDLLEKESYEKKIAGIEAWRKNPLNQLYLEITRESIDQGKPIKEILVKRKEGKQDSLSISELQAMIAFNREIMF